MRHYDIVIAGGGMVGSCLALALAPLGLRMAMVEQVARSDLRQPSFDDRSTALSRSSQRMFQAMGLWPEIAAASAPIASIHVSDQGRFGFSHIDAAEQKVEALGYVVINRVLGEVLQRALSSVEGLEVVCPASITGVRMAGGPVAIAVAGDGEGSRELSSSLLVAADGADSTVRRLAGIGAERREYGQFAIIGNVLPARPHANRAFERFTSNGALAFLPVTEHRAAFVWCMPSADAADAMALADDAFLESLQAAFGYRLGRLDRVGRRAAYPLALTRATRLVATRTVVMGNAANSLHPVAAQGFNLGLRDVAALSDSIADFLRSGGRHDPGDAAMLREYASWRHADHRKVVQFTDGLVRLFGSRSRPLRVLRDLGMLGFDLVPGVRGVFARHTMGLAGRLPRLSRGIPIAPLS